MGVEHHLLALARIGPHEQHPAVAEPDLRHLHRHRDAGDQHHLVAPVELVGLARREAQRHEGRRRRRGSLALPRRPHTAAPRRSRPRSRARAAPRRSGSASAAPGSPAPRSPPAAGRAPPATARASAAAAPPLVLELRRPGPQDLPHRVPRDVQLPAISLIDRPRTRNSRRTRAIVSTPFIPHPTRPEPQGQAVSALQRDRGSILDADPARSRGQHSTPIHTPHAFHENRASTVLGKSLA